MPTSNKLSLEKQIGVLTIGLAIIYIIGVVRDWELTKFMLIDYKNWDSSSISFFIPKILLPIGLWGLWTIKKYGWIIVTMTIVYFATSSLLIILYETKWFFEGMSETAIDPITSMLDEVFGRRPIMFDVGRLIFISVILFYINSQSILDLFKISKRTQLIVFGLISVPVLVHGIVIII